MDESKVGESLSTQTPVQKVRFRSPTKSSPGSTPGSSQKKRNGILRKLFSSSNDDITTGVGDVSSHEKTWGSPLQATPQKPMKSPGLVIPTPYASRKDDDFADFSTPNGSCFESELTDAAWMAVTNSLSPTRDNTVTVTDSLANERARLEKEIVSSAHEIYPNVTLNMKQDDNDDDHDDDSAFLPDDIREHFIKQSSTKDVHVDNKENNHSSHKVETSKPTRKVLSPTCEVLTPKAPSGMIPLAQVQALIDDAVREAQVKWEAHTVKELEEKNAAALAAIQHDAEKQLMEHGEQWNKEHEEELSQVKKEMESRMKQLRLEMEQDKREAEQRWIETSEQERSEFLDKIDVLVTTSKKEALEHQSQTKELRAEQNAKIHRLEKELQEHQDALEEGIASLTEATQEKNALSERIATLKATVMTLKDDEVFTKKAHEEEMQRLREETEAKLDLFTKQLTAASAVEAEELRSKISELEADSSKLRLGHEQSLVALAEAHKMELEKQKNESNDLIEKERQAASSIASAEKLELLAKIKTLETSLVSERETREQGETAHAEKMETVRKEIEMAHKLELEKQRDDFYGRMEKERQAALSVQSIASAEKLELDAKIDALETSLSRERDAHEEGKKVHAKEIEVMRNEKDDLEKEFLELKDSLETERKEWKTSLESKQEEMQSRYENMIQELEDRLKKQQHDFDNEKHEIMVMQRDASAKEKELGERLVALEQQVHMDKEEYAKELQQVRDKHTTEIDEMLAQLDLVEAENNQKYEAKLESIKQKEAIITALGAQLTEAAARTRALEDERQLDIAGVEAAREEADIARAASRSLQMSLDQLRSDHRKELEEERRKREEACQQVKEEMIAAAEEQFGKANKHYVKLKHEYDSTIIKIGRIERELKSSKRELDSCKKEQAAREVEMRAELAQLKAGAY
jgi:hypothetical protein